MRGAHARSVLFLLLASLGGLARGQGPCPSWAPGFQHVEHGLRDSNSQNDTDLGRVEALAIFDDGSGPRLFAGGHFDRAGASPVGNVARWGGSAWSAPGALTGMHVKAFATHDDGSGPALYACGEGTPQVARWDGTSWTTVGAAIIGVPQAMIEFDDGSGPKLYVATRDDHQPTSDFARVYVWDGASWSQLGGLFEYGVWAMAVYDDGTGSALYAAGAFLNVGGVPIRNIAKWNGSAWTPVGSGGATNGVIGSMAVYDEGSGPALFVGGEFSTIDGVPVQHVARWDGASWSALSGGVVPFVATIATIDAGTGPKLYVSRNGGSLPHNGHVLAWDGSNWSSLNSRGSEFNGLLGWWPTIYALAPDPSGIGLIAAGQFQYMEGREVYSLARWDGSAWSPLGPPPGDGTNGSVRALASVDLGAGPTLFAGGSFKTASGNYATDVARWDGSSWQATTPDTNGYVSDVSALAVFDDGSGPDLYAGGLQFRRWNGSSFSNVPATSPIGNLFALATFNGRLYMGGSFSGSGFNMIASFDGGALGDLGGGTNGAVMALAPYDDGGGARLYVGGAFTAHGSYLTRWTGGSWLPLPATPDGPVRALCEFDDGTGNALYVGGNFTHVGGLAANHIAKWDGTSWSALGSGLDGIVYTMAVFDDGSGPALYAGGGFTMAGGLGALFLARWDGSAWSPLGNGTNGTVIALAAHGPDLFIGGGFTSAGGVPSSYVAKLRECDGPGTRMCFGDGSLATPCPCNNFGGTSRGCENSGSTGGATLDSTGTTVPDTVVLFAEGERPTALTIFLQGTENHTSGFVYGDGLRCAHGTLKRLYTKTASGGAAAAPTMGEPSITARSAALGNPIAPGARRYYQTYYRDGNAAFCPAPAGSSFNSSNAVKIVW